MKPLPQDSSFSAILAEMSDGSTECDSPSPEVDKKNVRNGNLQRMRENSKSNPSNFP